MTASITDDLAAGLAARHEGQAATKAADVAVHLGAGVYIRTALDILAALGDPFTADDVRDMAQTLAHEDGRTFDPRPNLLPAFIGGLAKDGELVEVGRVASTRPSRRGSKVSLWHPTNPRSVTAAGRPPSHPTPR